MNVSLTAKELMAQYPRFEVSLLQYPIAWKLFLESKGLPDTPHIIGKEVGNVFNGDHLDGKKMPLLVLMQGIPGIGKSLFAIHISQALSRRGIQAMQTAQDDFNHLGKKAGKACQEFVEQSLLSQEYSVVFLARNNSNISQFRAYLDLDQQGICKLLFLCPKDLIERPAEAVYASMASVLHRKASKESHPTNSLDDTELATLPLKFFGELDTKIATLRVNFFRSESIPIPNPPLMDRLIRSATDKGFKMQTITKEELSSLRLDDPSVVANAKSFHRPIEEITSDVCDMIERLSRENIPSYGSYFCLLWDPELSERIINFTLSQSFRPLIEKWTIDADHITLMHSFNFLTDSSHWHNLESVPPGTVVNVKPLSLVYRPDKIVTLRVSLSFAHDGSSADHLVFSRLPHITISRANGVSAFYSVQVLQDPLPTDVVINVENDLPPLSSVLTNRFSFD